MLSRLLFRTPCRAINYSSKRTLVTLKDHKYTAHATAKGQGRAGEVKSEGLVLNLAVPKAMGGTGKGENPEQLFAMGYSSCFLGALQLAARQMGKHESAKTAVIHTNVHIGEPTDMPGFGLAVDIKVEGADEDVIKAAHELCPYSRALKHGIVVNVSKA
ncbi:organic hydroperoxide resistance protein [Tricholoma matsutake]|nr:organic hydroperoxide resistance protein [Tricholoma matsutake 945]